jgi:outer membrane lipoprotein-sorting protein
MKSVYYFIFALFFSFQLHAQVAGYLPVKDIASFKEKFSAASQKINSIESDFSQTKNLAMLKEKMISKGKFYYKRANKVRIEYTKPYSYLMVLNNNDMKVKDEHKTSNYNTRSNKMMQSINSIMLDCMRGTVYNNKEFLTSVFESNKEYLLVMMPSTSVMKKMFSKIEVYLDKSDYNVVRLNMIENGGDNSMMSFTNRTMNKIMDDALFSTK